MTVTLLVDDTRTFLPGVRDNAVTVTSTEDALAFLETVTHVDELWLDFNLTGEDDAAQVLFQLNHKASNGETIPTFGKVLLHSSAPYADDLMYRLLSRMGLKDDQVERIWNQREYFQNKK